MGATKNGRHLISTYILVVPNFININELQYQTLNYFRLDELVNAEYNALMR